jgi:hypothetical protein
MTIDCFFNLVIDLLKLNPAEQEDLRYEFLPNAADTGFDGFSICDFYGRKRGEMALQINAWIDQLDEKGDPSNIW